MITERPRRSPLQNRVMPDGEIVAISARGTVLGNRGGRIHSADRVLTRRRWASRAWISCQLSFKGRQRTVMSPGSYTELFFLDEATAFAAGHRPCFECRRAEANRFAMLWAQAVAADATGGRARAADMDRCLHYERLTSSGEKRTHRAAISNLPDGAMIHWPDEGARETSFALVLADRLLIWRPEGYVRARPRPMQGLVEVLTPESIIAVFRAGYRPKIHETAQRFS